MARPVLLIDLSLCDLADVLRQSGLVPCGSVLVDNTLVYGLIDKRNCWPQKLAAQILVMSGDRHPKVLDRGP